MGIDVLAPEGRSDMRDSGLLTGKETYYPYQNRIPGGNRQRSTLSISGLPVVASGFSEFKPMWVAFPGAELLLFSNHENLIKAAQKLGGLLELENNWDTYGAKKPNLSAVVSSFNFLCQVQHLEVPLAEIVPTREGGIQIEWHTNGVDLEIHFKHSGSIEMFFEDLSTGVAFEAKDRLVEYKLPIALMKLRQK